MKYLIFILIFALFSVEVCAVNIDPYMLASYIDGALGSGLAEMLAVGAVIRNRCYDERFPDSVIENGNSLGILPAPKPSKMAEYAAKVVMSGKDLTGGAVFMFPVNDTESVRLHEDHITFSSGGFCFSLK